MTQNASGRLWLPRRGQGRPKTSQSGPRGPTRPLLGCEMPPPKSLTTQQKLDKTKQNETRRDRGEGTSGKPRRGDRRKTEKGDKRRTDGTRQTGQDGQDKPPRSESHYSPCFLDPGPAECAKQLNNNKKTGMIVIITPSMYYIL